jgi:predicted ArsR family transcriptional regulator
MATTMGTDQSQRAVETRRARILWMLDHRVTIDDIAQSLHITRRTIERHRAAHYAGRPVGKRGPRS